MFEKRAQQAEHMDDLTLASEDLRKNLDEIVFFNRWFGSKHTLLKAMDEIYQKYKNYFNTQKIFIADLASGGGDLLDDISVWAKAKKIAVELIGIDANPFMINYAKERFKNKSCQYKTANILDKDFMTRPFDIACLNSVCHHFSDEDLVRLLKQLKTQTRLAIVINDLRRHWVPYYFIKLITKLFPTSALIKNDAPLSVLRAFDKKELIAIFKLAGISSYKICRSWAFRWRVIIWNNGI